RSLSSREGAAFSIGRRHFTLAWLHVERTAVFLLPPILSHDWVKECGSLKVRLFVFVIVFAFQQTTMQTDWCTGCMANSTADPHICLFKGDCDTWSNT